MEKPGVNTEPIWRRMEKLRSRGPELEWATGLELTTTTYDSRRSRRTAGSQIPRWATLADSVPVAYKQGISVNDPLTVFLLAPVVAYSSEVQQPMRATAILSRHPHTHWPAPFDREQGRAGSLHPGGMPRPCQNGRKTAVPSSHSWAPRTTFDLHFPRSATSAKRTPEL